jgi:hypothetical protein
MNKVGRRGFLGFLGVAGAAFSIAMKSGAVEEPTLKEKPVTGLKPLPNGAGEDPSCTTATSFTLPFHDLPPDVQAHLLRRTIV